MSSSTSSAAAARRSPNAYQNLNKDAISDSEAPPLTEESDVSNVSDVYTLDQVRPKSETEILPPVSVGTLHIVPLLLLTDPILSKALDMIGVGRAQLKLIVICGCWWAADAMEVMLLSFLLPQLESTWSLKGYDFFLFQYAIRGFMLQITN